jgi:antirestriction protein ArdC
MTMATTYRRKRRRLSQDERRAMENAALDRARSNPSWANFGQVIAEFAARGIAESEISPKENVFTYNAWRALGRQVRKGEHGVKITTWVEMSKRERDEQTGEEKIVSASRPTSAVVFHVSQTDPVQVHAAACA